MFISERAIHSRTETATKPFPAGWYLYALGGIAVARIAVALLAHL